MADVRGQAGVSSRDQMQRLGLSGYPGEVGAHLGTCFLGSRSGLYRALTSQFIAEQIETQGNGAKSWGTVCVSPRLAILSSQVFPEHLPCFPLNRSSVGSTTQKWARERKAVVYSFNKHLCIKLLLGANRVQGLRELMF